MPIVERAKPGVRAVASSGITPLQTSASGATATLALPLQAAPVRLDTRGHRCERQPATGPINLPRRTCLSRRRRAPAHRRRRQVARNHRPRRQHPEHRPDDRPAASSGCSGERRSPVEIQANFSRRSACRSRSRRNRNLPPANHPPKLAKRRENILRTQRACVLKPAPSAPLQSRVLSF